MDNFFEIVVGRGAVFGRKFKFPFCLRIKIMSGLNELSKRNPTFCTFGAKFCKNIAIGA